MTKKTNPEKISCRDPDLSNLQFKHDKYTVFNLDNYDIFCDSKFILTNKSLINDENEKEELLIPCFKDNLIKNFSYFEKFLTTDENSIFGKALVKREVDGTEIPVITIEYPRVMAKILKSAFSSGPYKLNVEDCIKAYKIYDFLNMEEETNQTGNYIIKNRKLFTKNHLDLILKLKLEHKLKNVTALLLIKNHGAIRIAQILFEDPSRIKTLLVAIFKNPGLTNAGKYDFMKNLTKFLEELEAEQLKELDNDHMLILTKCLEPRDFCTFLSKYRELTENHDVLTEFLDKLKSESVSEELVYRISELVDISNVSIDRQINSSSDNPNFKRRKDALNEICQNSLKRRRRNNVDCDNITITIKPDNEDKIKFKEYEIMNLKQSFACCIEFAVNCSKGIQKYSYFQSLQQQIDDIYWKRVKEVIPSLLQFNSLICIKSPDFLYPEKIQEAAKSDPRSLFDNLYYEDIKMIHRGIGEVVVLKGENEGYKNYRIEDKKIDLCKSRKIKMSQNLSSDEIKQLSDAIDKFTDDKNLTIRDLETSIRNLLPKSSIFYGHTIEGKINCDCYLAMVYRDRAWLIYQADYRDVE